jgi:hypothetical protein
VRVINGSFQGRLLRLRGPRPPTASCREEVNSFGSGTKVAAFRLMVSTSLSGKEKSRARLWLQFAHSAIAQ